MRKPSVVLYRLSEPLSLAVSLGVFLAAFQVFLLTRWPGLYLLLKILFVGLLAQALAVFVRAASKQKVLLLVILALVLVRLPFYLHPTGLITTSDNALEALQSQEIQSGRVAPFFQFEVLKHQGTWRYTLIAFLFDFLGAHYVIMLLWDLVVFTAVILLLAALLEPAASRRAALLLAFLGFAFIETMFDFSLLIRGGIYLDALLLPLIGMALFDFSYARKARNLLAFYFLFFALYIQPIAAFFAGSFLICVVVHSFRARRVWRNGLLMLVGAALGLYHQAYYYLFFPARPAATGAWEKITLLPLSEVSLRLAGTVARNFWESFVNLFRFEMSYLLEFFDEGKREPLLAGLNTVGMSLSLAMLAVATGLALFKVIARLLRKRDFRFTEWPYLFFLVLALAALVKQAVLRPARFEPRHNFDLLLLIILSYFFVFGLLLKGRKLVPLRAAAAAVMLAALTVPHYYFFYKMARYKEGSYQELMTTLRASGVRNLMTDFIIAYPIYFLSRRTIVPSDSLGPLTLRFFYPELKARVDALPLEDKAYLFFSEEHLSRPWHKRATQQVKARLLEKLRRSGLSHRTVRMRDYTLILPVKKT